MGTSQWTVDVCFFSLCCSRISSRISTIFQRSNSPAHALLEMPIRIGISGFYRHREKRCIPFVKRQARTSWKCQEKICMQFGHLIKSVSGRVAVGSASGTDCDDGTSQWLLHCKRTSAVRSSAKTLVCSWTVWRQQCWSPHLWNVSRGHWIASSRENKSICTLSSVFFFFVVRI